MPTLRQTRLLHWRSVCGLTGFWQRDPDSTDRLRDLLTPMVTALAHRGPDDDGQWIDPEAGVALGFRRLSIIDLSITGHQPMVSPDGAAVIVYNGEIYNFLEIRQELDALGVAFRGRSDTEVILAAYQQWGFAATLRRLNGMFAIALWDTSARCLWLARDRLGKKPLYYARLGAVWLFASELKALRQHPRFPTDLDDVSLSAFLHRGCIPAPRSIFAGVRKLAPGTFVCLSAEREPEPVAYWRADRAVGAALTSPPITDPIEAVDDLDRRLGEAVACRLMSDVPLGAFLSGGVDSSAVVSMMQARSTRPMRTFTIGFEQADYDEARDAAAVAAHLGTDHVEVRLTPADAHAVIPDLPDIYDEPFADSSQIPTFLVAKAARRHVTVALSGDGGDEVFGGYNRHQWAERLYRRSRGMPRLGRGAVASILEWASPALWDRVYGLARRGVPALPDARHAGDKIHKVADVLRSESPDDLYDRLAAVWPDPCALVSARPCPDGRPLPNPPPELRTITDLMMFRDLTEYLPDDILTKVDRATMAVGLEARSPLLDYRLVEWAWRLDARLRHRDGISKWVLRQVLYRYVPARLIDRPKHGFAIPIGEWLRGPLRQWAEDLLDSRRLAREGLLRPEPVRVAWRRHLAGTENLDARLWAVLMLEAWLARLH